MHMRHQKAMSSLHTAQQVLWLDPVQPLDAPEHAQLTAAGLSIRSINTLDELQSALSHGQTMALVIRHDTGLDLLQSCQASCCVLAFLFLWSAVSIAVI